MLSASHPHHIVPGLVRNGQGQVLLARSPKRGQEMPGGQIEEGESRIQALERGIWEEAGIEAQAGALVGRYSNVKPLAKVIFGLWCEHIYGELTTSNESLETVWVEEKDALARITHPAIHDQLKDMPAFVGPVIY